MVGSVPVRHAPFNVFCRLALPPRPVSLRDRVGPGCFRDMVVNTAVALAVDMVAATDNDQFVVSCSDTAS